jgi:hypothetical protein
MSTGCDLQVTDCMCVHVCGCVRVQGGGQERERERKTQGALESVHAHLLV